MIPERSTEARGETRRGISDDKRGKTRRGNTSEKLGASQDTTPDTTPDTTHNDMNNTTPDALSDVLTGVRVVLFALNLPGPAAAARLAQMGASVVKIEPLSGDPFEYISSPWYRQMRAGMEVRRVDLRQPASRAMLDGLLNEADVFITSFRRASLERLSLDPATVSTRFPKLCQVSITGFSGDHQHVAGHDLTYQAAAGLLDPHAMPRALIADLAGVERTVGRVMALLFARDRGHGALHAEVALADVAADFAIARRMGLTTPGSFLGGGNPFYGIYACREGHVALAALEPQFQRNLLQGLGNNALQHAASQHAALQQPALQLGAPQHGTSKHSASQQTALQQVASAAAPAATDAVADHGPLTNSLRGEARMSLSEPLLSANTAAIRSELQREFRARSAREWELWGETNDVPLTALAE